MHEPPSSSTHALPSQPEAASSTPKVRRRTPTIETLGAIWKELLQRDWISPDDDFFRLGGDSLLATILSGRLSERFSLEISPIFAFQVPTLRQMAERIDTLRNTAQSVSLGPLTEQS